ncbi:YqeB family protein [Streptomyces sp. MAR4 CNX-425]|uniref:YqeB family protein n=1 Tax=Streptomyces sp. MAR4 CNX-425 TaxID=3406343 RepID=UPI003B51006C
MDSGAPAMSRDDRLAEPAATVGPGLVYRLLLLAGLPALGALLGWLVPRIADRVAGLPWAPMQGPFELVASFDDGRTAVAGPAAGLVLGLGGGLLAFAMAMRVTFEDDTVRIRKDGESRILARAEVAAAFLDKDRLVILDADSRQLVRRSCDLEPGDLDRGFTAHGYRWLHEDPYVGRYHRWVPDSAELSAAANAVLKAREHALRKKNGTDAEELREEAQRLGYVLREEGARQYWRPLRPGAAEG